MKKIMIAGLLIVITFLLSATLIINAEEATTIEIENGFGFINDTIKVNITLSEAPIGISGYNITLTATNSSVVEIISVEFPDWGSNFLKANSTLPHNFVWIKALDLDKQIEENATDILLASLFIKAKSNGMTSINMSKMRIDDDEGFKITPNIENGSFIVGKPSRIVFFTDNSMGGDDAEIVNWDWKFYYENGTFFDCICTKNVTYEFPKYGKYYVNLMVKNECGKVNSTGMICIDIGCPIPVASFEHTAIPC